MDYIFSMMQEQEGQMEGLWKEAMGKRIPYDVFAKLIDTYTVDQQFLCWDIRDKSGPITERVYKGKAKDPGIFIVGCELYWSTNLAGCEKIICGKAREEAERKMDWNKWFPYQSSNLSIVNDDGHGGLSHKRRLARGFVELREARQS